MLTMGRRSVLRSRDCVNGYENGARGETRTLTPLSGLGILSPVRLPVSPPRHYRIDSIHFFAAAEPGPTHSRSMRAETRRSKTGQGQAIPEPASAAARAHPGMAISAREGGCAAS